MTDQPAGAQASGEGRPLPIFSRNATGLVKQVSLFQMFVYNATSTNPLGLGLISFAFALILFPRANPYITLVATGLMCMFVWTAFALMTAAMPRVGGDYTINTRILPPWLALGGNLAQTISACTGAVILSWGAGTLALSPALTVIGSATGSSTMTDWGNYFSTTHHNVNFITCVLILGGLSAICALGTRYAVRLMTALILLATAGLIVSVIVIIFKSHSDFISTVNSSAGAGAYQKTVAAGAKAGLSPDHGYSTRSTIGACFYGMAVLIYAFWGTYMSAEFKGAGQRRRQLISMTGAGITCLVGLLAIIYLFLHTIGYNFFVSSLAGNYTGPGSGTIGVASYVYFSALVASSHLLVIIIGLCFVGWFLPAAFINLSMPQRALLTWSFDGLLPRRLSVVDDRTHTPIISIVLTFIICIPIAAFLAYTTRFFAVVGVNAVFSFFSIVLVGISAAIVKWRRPDIYRGSPAEWRLLGVEVLPIAGVGCALVGMFGIFLGFYFHTELGIVYFHGMEFASVGVFVLAIVWWLLAGWIRREQGLDLSLSYKSIPPE
jgi:basic amino acid/polyamine antiporter, APA family